MAYLRLISPSNDNWATRDERNPPPDNWGQRRYGVMPPPRRRFAGNILLGMIAMPMGVWGLWLLLGAGPAETTPQPLVFQVPPAQATPAASPGASPGLYDTVAVADGPRGLKIVLTTDARPVTHPETWGALPTAVGAPVVASPLADAVPAEDVSACRDAPTLAAQMTCIDPTLREAEQRMTLAYDAVLAAGVPPAALGRSQARWLATREAMAQTSPENLLTAYQQRESQLRSYAVAWEQRTGSVGQTPPPKPVVLGLGSKAPTTGTKGVGGEATT